VNGSLSVLVLRALKVALEERGHAGGALLAELNVSSDLLAKGDARLPADMVFRAIERAAELTGDECFCLRAAGAVPLGTIDVLDFAMRSSRTMGEALERATRYYALIDDRTELALEVEGGLARLAGKRKPAASPRRATELLFALLLHRGRQLTGRAWPLREVCFFRGPPSDPSGHERFFGVPVRFGRPRNELVFDASWLSVPCLAHDEALATFFDRHAGTMLDRLSNDPSLLARARRAVADGLAGGEPSLESTARRLSLSERTLQRRLHEGGTSHSELVEDVRRDLALRLLAERRTTIPEIAYLVGFCDTSTFYRAFKRWTGKPPATYRRTESPQA
jgi:AraC-like DNA-binding protein